MDRHQQVELLHLARDCIRAELGDGSIHVETPPASVAATIGGAFVTLRNAGRLRGCVGTFKPKPSLQETVVEVARLACRDARFQTDPVTLAEMDAIALEISIVSALKHTDDPLGLQIGVHGIYLRREAACGCFLPKVALEYGWDAEKFLSQCCTSKAGLPADAWRLPDTDVHLFTVVAFEDDRDTLREYAHRPNVPAPDSDPSGRQCG